MLKCMQSCVNHLKIQQTLLSNQTNVLIQQSRNTFILKRQYPVPLAKKNKSKFRFAHKHYIYDLVENTELRPQKMIDLVLLETVKGLGERGQVVQQRSQSAYQYYILPRLAVYATPENIVKYARKDIREDEFSSQFVENTMSILSETYLPVTMSMDVPWTIEKWHVKASFRKNGFIVPEDAITLPEKAITGPNLAIENKEFYVVVKINNREEVKVRCKIHHYTPNQDKKVKYETPYYLLPSIAIFPEDQEVLNTLPKHPLIEEHKAKSKK